MIGRRQLVFTSCVACGTRYVGSRASVGHSYTKLEHLNLKDILS